MNLISPGYLDDEGYTSIFANGVWKLSKGSLIMAKGKKCCSLYQTTANIMNENSLAIVDDSTPNLWHQRLGHINKKGMQVLAKNYSLPNFKGSSLKPCDDCFFGKQHRVSFARLILKLV